MNQDAYQTMPHEAEGVIKFQMRHKYQSVKSDWQELRQMNAWRHLLFRLQMIGQDDKRYGGLAFGNVSRRRGREGAHFWVSATQTSSKAFLSQEELCEVMAYDLQQHILYSRGLAPPSSETLTHASIYQAKAQVSCVIHVHSPDIWLQTHQLGLAHTDSNISYGTHAMVEATQNLLDGPLSGNCGLYTMLGHEDGVVAFAENIADCAELIIRVWVEAQKIVSTELNSSEASG